MDNTGVSIFQFLVRNGSIKHGKIKRIDACYMVHRSQTLLWYNQCNGGYGQFATAGTISFNGVFTLGRREEGWMV